MNPNLIHIAETVSRVLYATSADVVVSIQGQSLYTGKKAAELRELIAKLAECNIPEGEISLVSVSAKSSTGLISKSSSVEYRIQAKCPSIESLGPALAAIASQKNAQLLLINWKYPDYEKSRGEILSDCVAAAKLRAEELSRSLGTMLLAVHKLTYEIADADKPYVARSSGGMAAYAAKARLADDALENLNLSHCGILSVTVKAEFIVGDFSEA